MKPNGTVLLTRLGGGLRRPGPFHRTTRIVLSLVLVLSHPLWAATIIVDETTCTLVDAITAANTDTATGSCAAGSGADTIELTTNVSLSAANNVTNYYNSNGLPVIATDITIEGKSFVIERSPSAEQFRLFHVLPSGTLTLNDLTLRNGRVTWYYSYGGAIESYGTVVLTNSTLSDNFAENSGGAIHHHGPGALILVNSTVSDNFSGWPGHVDYGSGGRGGGITISGGTASLTNTTVSGNTASAFRGCCDNVFDCTGSCFGTGIGGGIALTYGSLSVTNTTVWGNSANARSGGFDVSYGGSIFLKNSIVAGNGVNCDGSGGAAGCTVADLGNNLSDDDTFGAGVAVITPGVDFDTTLADNGGPTLTHALLAGSVAMDAAGDCGLETDQRGLLRWDGVCDSGAFEYGAMSADADQDGVVDDVDICLDTVIPESVPTKRLGVNRWALVDDDDVFDTTPPPGGGGGPEFEFSVEDTRGCSCEQIIAEMGLGWGHTKFGCSTGAMLQWVNQVWPPELTYLQSESQSSSGGIMVPDLEPTPSSASSGEAPTASGPRRQVSPVRRQAPRRDQRKK